MANRFLDIFSGGSDGQDPFASMQRDFERMLGDFRKGMPALRDDDFAPALDIHEVEGGVEVTAELPGVAEEDITLELHDDLLTLKGEKKEESEKKDEKTGAIHRERRYGGFARTLRLPYAPEAGAAKASFDKGVLKVSIPKPPEVARKTSRIKIGS